MRPTPQNGEIGGSSGWRKETAWRIDRPGRDVTGLLISPFKVFNSFFHRCSSLSCLVLSSYRAPARSGKLHEIRRAALQHLRITFRRIGVADPLFLCNADTLTRNLQPSRQLCLAEPPFFSHILQFCHRNLHRNILFVVIILRSGYFVKQKMNNIAKFI